MEMGSGLKVWIAGHGGMVGKAISETVERATGVTWIGERSNDLDLRSPEQVAEYVSSNSPDAVVLSAAKVGGIEANRRNSLEFLSSNLKIEISVLEACLASKIPKLIFLSSSCVYPKFAAQPIKETAILSGSLEETNKSYALAKLIGQRYVEIANEDFDLDWKTVFPTNVYGPGDNYDPMSSHVLAAIIRKVFEAKKNGDPFITLWGDGSPKREFIHTHDLSSAILALLLSDTRETEFNIGTGSELSISELADLICRIADYKGKIKWDQSMPNGTPRKLLDSSKIRALGWSPNVSLEKGIEYEFRRFSQLRGHLA